MEILLRSLVAIWGSLFGAMMVAIPAAIIWGSNGPAWPFIPLAIMAALTGYGGWRFSHVIFD